MDWRVVGLIVAADLAFAAAFVLFFVNQRRQDQARAERLRDWASQRGWSFQAQPSPNVAYALNGRDANGSWELTVSRMRGSSQRGSRYCETVWRSAGAALPGVDEVVLIGLRFNEGTPNLSLGGGLLGKVMAMVLKQMFDVEASGLELQTAGSTLFQQKFIAFSRTAESARRLVTSSVEGQLLNWPFDHRAQPAPFFIGHWSLFISSRSLHALRNPHH